MTEVSELQRFWSLGRRGGDRWGMHTRSGDPLRANLLRPPADEAIRGMALAAITSHSAELGTHARNVATLARVLGHRLGVGRVALRELMLGAELHDIGKLAIPPSVLNKSGRLSEAELWLLRQHTVGGERILGGLGLARVARIVRSTHERWDGTGYPDRLTGDEIPLASRIVFVCDSFDAMITARPYQTSWGAREALAEIKRCSGNQFDPCVVAAFADELGSNAPVKSTTSSAGFGWPRERSPALTPS